ncbi:SpoIIE family protein phosphatase [Leptospira sp. 2 VSF19]|uniref:SpoIIE family protein phosphatase n=1 Tax=Leptospira soteropolitanensis TaxID=2950025 RepID=A0AAW5VMI6_9LEPT|nr:SpoIIE family protein phosphatase [Leptospira soteropolitanensis]MCW7492082.1 SpoIIE family protein phosphatase [Leptospira soteropolitanensis]MCW7499664.1 SpoIIE family protein phosphatase [Leptospira soteropolitanensis]MCW7521915.1 SpoIIE family protein phosphatase [Leptospira soteropolitanensis]MCW7525769.1 SpoIIE family protein phosphatase [Leptospira soteropolitanensis]MCW7530117.1 SpoIIE family protein phosphatase [Leptospira soteropolitanensis]
MYSGYRVRELFDHFLYVIKTKSFLKLFLSIITFLIFPYFLLASSMIYSRYKEALDWNQRYQLIRIQLLAIDLENQIRDQIGKDNFEKKAVGIIPAKEIYKIQNHCLPSLTDSFHVEEISLLQCDWGSGKKTYLFVLDGKNISIHSAEFLEEALLDSPYSDPNEGLFLLGDEGNFGISGFIENEFLVSEFWRSDVKSSLQTHSSLPSLRETKKDEMDYFVASYPMYGLPFHLFIVSPKDLVLIPIKESLKKNTVILISLLFLSFVFSIAISLKEIESKQKLRLLLQEFPHAAILYDSKGKILLENPEIEPNLLVTNLFRDQLSVKDWIEKEVSLFLQDVYILQNEHTKLRKEESEFYSFDGSIYLLEFTYQLWFLEQKYRFASGALVLIQNVTKKRLEFEKEMEYAKDLQKKYLPNRIIFLPNLDYEVLYKPLIQVGGDYYDYIDLGNNRSIFALGDVIGHGVKAAMMMTVLRVLFHQIVKTESDPKQILKKMNEGISNHFPDPYAFVPFLFLLFDFNQNMVTYGNAGHPGMLYVSGNEISCPEKLNPMFGMLPSIEPKVLEYPIQKGDRFFLFTDGLKDVENSKQEKIWENELTEFFISMKSKHMSLIKQELELKIRSYSEGIPFLDDITWIGIEVI